MKKVLLFSLFLLSTLSVFAYETVIIKYPPEELWQKVYYRKVGNEAILQLVPKGQSYQNWTRTIIVHAYNFAEYPIGVFMANNIAKMQKNNPSGKYKYLRVRDNDMIAGRCTENYNGIQAQCEIFRASRAHEGIISIHYINRNKSEFMREYDKWYDIIRKAKYYNSYYRDERILDKAEFYELW